MNHPFLSTSGEFGLRGAGVRVQGGDLVLERKSGHLVPAFTPFLLVMGQPIGLYSPLSLCFKMASDRTKWSNYVHIENIGYSRCEHNTINFAGAQALVPGLQVWVAP